MPKPRVCAFLSPTTLAVHKCLGADFVCCLFLLAVYGVLLGTQQGREIDIQNSFEITLDATASADSPPIVNHAFLKARQSQYKQVFPTLDLLGWYTVGEVPTPRDLEIHKQLLAYNETPLLVQLSQTVASFENAEATGALPIRVYESVVEVVQGETASFFVPAGYKIETGEAERIAVDHASKAGAESGQDQESTSRCPPLREELARMVC